MKSYVVRLYEGVASVSLYYEVDFVRVVVLHGSFLCVFGLGKPLKSACRYWFSCSQLLLDVDNLIVKMIHHPFSAPKLPRIKGDELPNSRASSDSYHLSFNNMMSVNVLAVQGF